MDRIGGTCFLKIDGEQFGLIGEAEVETGEPEREPVVGPDGLIYYTETPKAGFIRGKFAVPPGLDPRRVQRMVNSNVVFESAAGTVYAIPKAVESGKGKYASKDGSIDVEFFGKCEVVR